MLRKFWQGWKRVAEAVGTFQAKVILGLLYPVILGPIAMVRRLVSDPLGLRRESRRTYWIARRTVEGTLEDARKQ